MIQNFGLRPEPGRLAKGIGEFGGGGIEGMDARLLPVLAHKGRIFLFLFQ